MISNRGRLPAHDFRTESSKAVADAILGSAIRKTADILYTRRATAVAGYPGFEDLRSWGRGCKLEVSGRLEDYAAEFACRLEAAGGIVHFACDAAEAAEVVTAIATRRGARVAVKSKSMTAEEISLNEALAEAGVQVTETDLGEFIIQLAGEKPSHILAPAIHMNRAQVAELFHKTIGTPPDPDVEDLVRAARNALRQRFLAAELGITGGNFAVAETGTLVLVTNEGNGRMTTSLPPVQIAIVGIDKIIPKMSDLPGFLTLLTRSASGQVISSYVSIITGPRRPGEDEGPEELHVVLLDNGRSSLAGGPFREMLHCLHCGACLNQCPVYRAVGGHAYRSVYPGPMGDVLSTLLWGLDAYPDLPDACTLCGRCTEACPVKIPLPDYHRKLRVLRAQSKTHSWMAAGAVSAATAHPIFYRSGLSALRQLLGNGRELLAGKSTGALGNWKTCRDVPRPQEGPSFRAWWRERERKRK
jgi:L-lactate dehydrogenase complex protein LldF